MMSPKYWNLPKPGLIISITGNAAEFKEDNELSAHDQPYVLFKVDLPNASEDQKVEKKKLPEDQKVEKKKLFLPVRKFRDFKSKGDANEASKCDAISKNDSLSDVLFRIADYTAQSSADVDAHICRRTVAFWGLSLSNLAKGIEFWGQGIKFWGEAKKRIEDKAKERIEDVSSELTITFESGNPELKFVVTSGKLQDKEMVDKENKLFQTFMQKLNDLKIFSCVKVTFFHANHPSPADTGSPCMDVSSPKQTLSVDTLSSETSSRKTLTLNFKSLDTVTVRDVKGKIREHPDMKGNRPLLKQQRLMFAGKQLEDHCTECAKSAQVPDCPLAHYNIASDSKLELELISSKTIQIRRLIKDAEIFLPLKTDQEMLLDVRVFHSDKFTDFQRRIENLSLLGQERFKDGKLVLDTEEDASCVKIITKKHLTLTQPVWRESTVILYGTDTSKHDSWRLFSKQQFDSFKRSEEKHRKCVLLRTQGTGCDITQTVIERVLNQVAFLLPLQFGSVWILDGGSNKGIMQVDCVCLAPII